MANYSTLKAAVNQYIKQNGNKDITGPVLNSVLTAMIDSLGANYTFAGIATPSTNPGTPDQNVFYFAMQGGTYTNFGAMALPEGISLLLWNGSWTSQTIMYNDGGVFDISVYKSTGGTLETFADLSAALGTGGANIPEAARKGGMSIRFVQTSDNKYVRYNLLADSFTTDTTKWAICDDGVYVDNPEFVVVFVDANKRIGYGLRKDGDFYFGAGCPQQIRDYISSIITSISAEIATKVDKVQGKGLSTNDFTNDDKSVVELERLIENREWLYALLDANMRLVEGIKFDGSKEVYIDTFFNKVRFLSDESKQDFLDYLNVQQRQGLSQLVVDLPVSNGTDIQSGYAYIDSTDRCVKVKV